MSLLNTRLAKVNLPPRAGLTSRAIFFTACALVYTTAIVSATLTLNPYFSQTWDVNTFIHAARTFFDDGNWFDLYAQSRAAQTWPYAYPPLHAFVVALALGVGNVIGGLPDYVWARVPVIGADIGVALVLYHLVLRKANDETGARAAALLWLFNPLTFYNTAVQGHFESEWLFFILLAYAWLEDARHIIPPTLALALAVLFKQTAIVFALPLWMEMLKRKDEDRPGTFRLSSLILHLCLVACIIAAVCLPFLLYSDDFLFMNLTYVENVPVQTASWLVALLGLTRGEPNALTSDFFLFRYQMIVTMLAVIVVAFVGARRGWGLYLTATLIALAFVLTSKKVMGYYYVMLLPFLLVEGIRRRRFARVLIMLVATTFISLAPYYAAWTNHAHWWVYAMWGTANSLFFAGVFVWLIAERQPPSEDQSRVDMLWSAVVVSLGLFATATCAAWLQPFLSNNGSPIRAPIVAAGMETRALIVLAVLIGLSVMAGAILTRALRHRAGTVPRLVYAVIVIFAPLFFSVYTLTKETTAILEVALRLLGV